MLRLTNGETERCERMRLLPTSKYCLRYSRRRTEDDHTNFHFVSGTSEAYETFTCLRPPVNPTPQFQIFPSPLCSCFHPTLRTTHTELQANKPYTPGPVRCLYKDSQFTDSSALPLAIPLKCGYVSRRAITRELPSSNRITVLIALYRTH